MIIRFEQKKASFIDKLPKGVCFQISWQVFSSQGMMT